MPYYYPIVRVCDFVNFQSTKATERVRKRKQTYQTCDVGKLCIQIISINDCRKKYVVSALFYYTLHCVCYVHNRAEEFYKTKPSPVPTTFSEI